MSSFLDVASLRRERIWDGVTGRIVHGERATLGVIELEPNSSVPEHSHENEQIGIIATGSLTFTVGEETRRLGPGGMWCILANTPHKLRVGPAGAVVIEVFAPPRDDWQGLEQSDPTRPRWPG